MSPVTEENVTNVDIYLPNEKYYSFSTLLSVEGRGEYIHLTDIPYTDIPVHIRGGSIVPLRISGASTTTELRTKDFELLIAPDADGRAEGDLYLDDGESQVQTNTTEIHFSYRDNALEMSGAFAYDAGSLKIVKITVLGDDPDIKKLDLPLTGEVSIRIENLPSY